MTFDERTYWALRARQEIALGKAATDTVAAERHRRRAQIYVERAMMLAREPDATRH